jgi:hypothetical protein
MKELYNNDKVIWFKTMRFACIGDNVGEGFFEVKTTNGSLLKTSIYAFFIFDTKTNIELGTISFETIGNMYYGVIDKIISKRTIKGGKYSIQVSFYDLNIVDSITHKRDLKINTLLK